MTNKLQISKRLQKILGVLVLIIMIPVGQAMADPLDDDLGDPDNTHVPIDGGLSVLLVTGAGYGIRKIYLQRRNEKNNVAE